MMLRTLTLKSLAAALCAAAACGWASMASAALIVNDTWQDSDRATQENGVDSDADTDIESAWFSGGTGAALTPTAGNLSMDVPAGSANWTTYFAAEGSEVNLANNGDKLRVTWTFVPTGVNASNTSQNFRFGVVNTPAAIRLAADGSPAGGSVTNPYTGYGVFANMGATLGNSNPFQLRERTSNTGGSNIFGTSGEWTGLANGATSGADGFDSGATYTMVWEMTRNGAGLDVNVSLSGIGLDGDGVASVNINDPDGNGFAFDTFNIRPSGDASTAATFETKLFRVETFIVPEPATLALFGLGSVLVLGLTRRR